MYRSIIVSLLYTTERNIYNMQYEKLQKIYRDICDEENRITPLSIQKHWERIDRCRRYTAVYCSPHAMTSNILSILHMSVYSSLNTRYSDIEVERIIETWANCVKCHHKLCSTDRDDLFNPFELIRRILVSDVHDCILKEERVLTLFLRVESRNTTTERAVVSSVIFKKDGPLDGAHIGPDGIAKICSLLTICLLDANVYNAKDQIYSVCVINGFFGLIKKIMVLNKVHIPELDRFLELCESTVYKNESLAEVISDNGLKCITMLQLQNNKMLSFVNEFFCDLLINITCQ